MDLRVEKIFKFASTQRVSAAIEAFNIFDYTSDADYDGFMPTLPAVNANFGKPRRVVENTTRRFQVALRYTF